MSSIDRTPHALKREKSLIIPRHVIFFDTETKQVKQPNGDVKQTLKLGWVCYYRRPYGRNLEQLEWYFFDNIPDFWKFINLHTEKKRRLWVIACNMSFDFTIVQGWKYLGKENYKLKFFHNSGSTCIISVKSDHGSIIFIDSMNWFRESVEASGKRLGIPKLKIDFDKTDDLYLSTYCKRDVEILVALFKDFVKFLEANRISRVCYTIASTAMAAYLFGFYDHKIYIHNNEQAIDLERASYRGGRVECFYLGRLKTGPYHIVDVNSLYATVMHNGKFPCKFLTTRDHCNIDTLRYNLESKAMIARVLIETDEPAYAVKRDRTIFPVGRFWVTLTTPELVYALQHDHIRKVGRFVFYQHEKLFSRYVKRMYDLRLEFKSAGVQSYSEICKLLLNSLYGKFGQKAEIWEKIGECPGERDRTEAVYLPDQNRRGMIRYLLGEIFELTGYEECFNSFPAIASTVTAYARMYLYELMKTAGSGNYFYCDTDSLIVNDKGLENLGPLINEINLGCLKIEESIPWVNIRGLKDYETENKSVIKGISKNALQLESGVYQQDQWPSLRGILRGTDSDSYTVKKVTKILNRKYTKGEVTSDGWIRPFSLCDPDQLALWPD